MLLQRAYGVADGADRRRGPGSGVQGACTAASLLWARLTDGIAVCGQAERKHLTWSHFTAQRWLHSRASVMCLAACYCAVELACCRSRPDPGANEQKCLKLQVRFHLYIEGCRARFELLSLTERSSRDTVSVSFK